MVRLEPSRRLWHRLALMLGVGFVLACPAVPHALAAPILTPPGLLPGQQYQLVFVTSTTRDGTSSNIADYNALVTGVANGAGFNMINGQPVTWSAIGSTPTVNANVNALVVDPVYNLAGQLVSTGFADMWDGSIANPIEFDQTGADVGNAAVWTGTTSSGVGAAGLQLGAGGGNSVIGAASFTDSRWVDIAAINQTGTFRLYALSDPITVPGAVTVIPEPSTLALLGTSLAGLMGGAWWRRPTRAA